MQTWLKPILIGLLPILSFTADAQVKFKLELLPDEVTYQVSLVSDTSWTNPPFNLTASAQVTIRAPHGKPPYNFRVENLTPLQPDTDWEDNVYCVTPPEAPAWDYVSFALISPGTGGISYEKGLEVPLFSFTNGAPACIDSLELVDNSTDPFMPPNSKGVNVGNNIVVVGGGLGGSYSGNVGTGRAPCRPVLVCNDTLIQVEEKLCEGDPFRGMFFEEDTIIEDHYISCSGCDSLVQIHIKIQPNYNLVKEETICLGETYNDKVYLADTTIFESFVTNGGCDSFQTTSLKIIQPSVTNFDTLLCYGNTYDGIAYFEDAVVHRKLTSEEGCDSVVTAFIEVYPFEFFEEETTICEGETVNGQVYESDAVVEETFFGENGCDSLTVQTNITVNPNTHGETEELLVWGDEWYGVPYFEDETVIQILENEHGCDSILTAELTVFPPNTTIEEITICEGESLLGQTIINDTLLTDTINGTNLLVLDVNVIPAVIIYKDSTICAGHLIDGIPQFTDTVLTEVVHGTDMCEAVIITDVHVIQQEESFQNASICLGEDYNGIPYVSNVVLVDTLISVMTGCDSLVYTNLEVIPPKETFLEAEICAGEMYEDVIYHNDEIIFKELNSDLDGCDSLVQINLTVHPNPTPEIFGEKEFCKGEFIDLTTETYEIYKWNTGSFESHISISQSGTYELTVTDSNGCFGSTAFEVEALEVVTSPSAKSPNCHNPKGTIIFENTTGGNSPYAFSIDGGQVFETDSVFENLVAGQYDLTVEDLTGCRRNHTLFVPEEHVPEVFLPNDKTLDLGDSIWLTLQMNFPLYDTIIWSPPIGLSCPDCPNPTARPLKTTHFTVTVFDESGCPAEAEITLFVSQKSKVYIPNVFSPNDDGTNDRFYPFSGGGVRKVNTFKIFDRNGALVFDQKDFPPNTPSFGWNGGEYPPAVYTWFAEIEFINNRIEIFKGSVTLVR